MNGQSDRRRPTYPGSGVFHSDAIADKVAERWPVLSRWAATHSAGQRYEYAPVRIRAKFLSSSLPVMAALGASFQLQVASVEGRLSDRMADVQLRQRDRVIVPHCSNSSSWSRPSPLEWKNCRSFLRL